jgi:hypothetical protein
MNIEQPMPIWTGFLLAFAMFVFIILLGVLIAQSQHEATIECIKLYGGNCTSWSWG